MCALCLCGEFPFGVWGSGGVTTPLTIKLFGSREDLKDSALLLRDAFDMLEEDYEIERFFATMRHTYWQAATGTADRRVADALIQALEF